ncbi:hypothetical protein TanjilG_27246 [Lupinus angustifolius]|uniref:RRM domain-containing protein n=1 Tax=Lupinus angustifolius TaxID=3871 RepID=A0A1J7FVI8_LUPAN|nr:hypothetical protein TanjilG_27246 [Lupinus angustifolius]
MASSYSAPVSAAQVGSYFVGQYYEVLRQQPNLLHQFYSHSSTMLRIDHSHSTETAASTLLEIHSIVMSLNFATIEITTINSLDSWDGGVLVMVSASDYGWEEEATEYVNSVHIDDDPIDKYSLPEQQQHLQEDHESETVVEENPPEKASPPIQSVEHIIRQPSLAVLQVYCEEPPKKTWASILQVSKDQSVLSADPQHAAPHSFRSGPPPSELNHVARPAVQQSSSASTMLNFYVYNTYGEVTSVYVRNLPADVTEAEIDKEFKKFGKIKPDGIFVRVRKEIGVCYAFVEFGDTIGVQNALQEQEGEEAEAVIKPMLQGGGLVLGARAGAAIRILHTIRDSTKKVDDEQSKYFGRKAVSFILITVTGGVALSALNDLAIYQGCSRKAMEKAINNQAVRDAIGEPIVKGPWYNASLAVAHKRHSVSCSFPVSGPQGSGVLQLKAVRTGDNSWSSYLLPRDWEILIMDALLHVPGNDEQNRTLRINVTDKPPCIGTECIPRPSENSEAHKLSPNQQ